MLLLVWGGCLVCSPAAAQVRTPTSAEVVRAAAGTPAPLPAQAPPLVEDATARAPITEEELRDRLLDDPPAPPSLPYDFGLVLQLREFIGQMTTYRSEVVTVRIDPLKPRCTFQFKLKRDGTGARK